MTTKPTTDLTAADFVQHYQMLNMGWIDNDAKPTTGLCATCKHRQPGYYDETLTAEENEDKEDWCYLYHGAYMDGSEDQCPAWAAHLQPTIKHGAWWTGGWCRSMIKYIATRPNGQSVDLQKANYSHERYKKMISQPKTHTP